MVRLYSGRKNPSSMVLRLTQNCRAAPVSFIFTAHSEGDFEQQRHGERFIRADEQIFHSIGGGDLFRAGGGVGLGFHLEQHGPVAGEAEGLGRGGSATSPTRSVVGDVGGVGELQEVFIFAGDFDRRFHELHRAREDGFEELFVANQFSPE